MSEENKNFLYEKVKINDYKAFAYYYDILIQQIKILFRLDSNNRIIRIEGGVRTLYEYAKNPGTVNLNYFFHPQKKSRFIELAEKIQNEVISILNNDKNFLEKKELFNFVYKEIYRNSMRNKIDDNSLNLLNEYNNYLKSKFGIKSTGSGIPLNSDIENYDTSEDFEIEINNNSNKENSKATDNSNKTFVEAINETSDLLDKEPSTMIDNYIESNKKTEENSQNKNVSLENEERVNIREKLANENNDLNNALKEDLIVSRDDLENIIKRLDKIDETFDVKNTNKLFSEMKNIKNETDILYKDTSEKAKNITKDYETFTKQWVVKDLKTKVDNLKNQIITFNVVYIVMIVLDIGAIIGCVLFNIWGLPKLFEKEILSFWQHFSAGILFTAPVLTTLLWLTRYFNRRIHECVHLKEDYENKYINMLVFDGFKDKISSYGKEATYEYIIKVINRITENPTSCLSKGKSDMIPSTEVAEIIKAVLPTIYNSKNDENNKE